jgi:hypothetical protein
MSVPAAAIPLALAGISAISSIMSGNKQAEAQERAIKEAKAQARRSALERAIGLGAVGRQPTQSAPPNLFPYQAVNSLAQLGSQVPWDKVFPGGK